jgi:hypothetical protein
MPISKRGFMVLHVRRLVSFIGVIMFARAAHSDCFRPALAHQMRDAATIQRLESAWTVAYLSGDTQFEACLLTPDFTEIMSSGTINRLGDELALAERNQGKPVTNPNIPPPTIHIHGDVAVAYGLSAVKVIEGKPHRSYYADYYVWENRSWHVYFAQQTSFPM